eukprot:c25337_g2_i1 orf=203-583(+)
MVATECKVAHELWHSKLKACILELNVSSLRAFDGGENLIRGGLQALHVFGSRADDTEGERAVVNSESQALAMVDFKFPQELHSSLVKKKHRACRRCCTAQNRIAYGVAEAYSKLSYGEVGVSLVGQ